MAVNRPGRNGTYIYFNDATLNGTVVLSYDCGWSTNVIYSGSTIIINAPYAWVPGHQYYVTLDSGLYCYIYPLINSMLFLVFKAHRVAMIFAVSLENSFFNKNNRLIIF
jgi:hypothetical protein